LLFQPVKISAACAGSVVAVVEEAAASPVVPVVTVAVVLVLLMRLTQRPAPITLGVAVAVLRTVTPVMVAQVL
jgi:hypothetical protein